MNTRELSRTFVCAALVLLGCNGGIGGAPGTVPPEGTVTGAGGGAGAGAGGEASAGGGEGGLGDEAPVPTEGEWEVLRSFSPATLPPAVADVSNLWADDDAAAALGQKLFFDAAFSGKLLDSDNDGGPNTLGVKGESGRVSCAGCHLPKSGFSDTRSTFQEISLGTGWTHRRTPSLLDVGQAKIVMWGGRHSTLWSQVFGPLENPLEMNSSRLFVAQDVAKRYAAEYEAVFGSGTLGDSVSASAFPELTAETTGCKLTQDIDQPQALPPNEIYECHGMPGDGAEYDSLTDAQKALVTGVVVKVGKAMAAYERRLECGKGRFDDWVAGDARALSPAEQRGALLFIGKGKCASCHSGPSFSDQSFHNVGLEVVVTKEGFFNGNDEGAFGDLPAAIADEVGIKGPFSDGDDGRLPDAAGDEHMGAFRTPTLRCVNRRPSFMHTGTMHALETVVAFFSRGGDESGFLGTSELEPLGLTTGELMDLVAFLKALDGPGPSEDLLQPR